MLSFPDLCRLCISSKNLKFNLGSADSDNITVHDKLNWLEPNILQPGDNLPTLICETCNEKLSQLYTFKEQCLQSYEKLRSYALNFLEVTSSEDVTEVKQELLDISEEHFNNSGPEANSDVDYLCKTEIDYSESELSDSLLIAKEVKKSSNKKDHRKINTGLVTRLGAIRSEESLNKRLLIRRKCETRGRETYAKTALNSLKDRSKTKTNDSESEILIATKEKKSTNKKIYRKINTGLVNRLGAVRNENNRYEYTLHTSDSEKVVYISNFREKIFSCTNCKKYYTNFSSLRKHLLVHSKEKPYRCEICGKETYTKSALNSHKVSHLEGSGSEICKECGKTFKSKDRLRIHSQSHNKSYMCDTCGKKFSNVSALKKHIICAHSNKRDFVCTICGFAAKTPDYLKRHMGKHSTEKTFECEICKKLLKNRSSFTIHMKRHDNNRKYVCHVCNKSFVVKGQYDVHFRIHSNEKPYLCTHCGKRFRRQDHYKNHVRIHTNEKPFACETCDKAFAQKISLVLHRKTHEKIKSFNCEYCGNFFFQDSKYQNHLVVCMST